MPDLHSPRQWLRVIARSAKRLMILIVGFTVLLAGIAMLALPGPGMLVIILGLVILAQEFAWAEKVLDRTASTAAGAATKVTGNNTGRAALAFSGCSLIVGGIVGAILFPQFIVVGISVAIGGAIGLITLLPKVRAWIDEKAMNGRTPAPEAAPEPSEGVPTPD